MNKFVKFFIILLVCISFTFNSYSDVVLKIYDYVQVVPPGKYVVRSDVLFRYGTIKTYSNDNFDVPIQVGCFRGLQEITVTDGNYVELTNSKVIKLGSLDEGVSVVDTDKNSIFSKGNNIDVDHLYLMGDRADRPLEMDTGDSHPPLKIQILIPSVTGENVFEANDINQKLYNAGTFIYNEFNKRVMNSPNVEDIASSVYVLDVKETACTKKRFIVEFDGDVVQTIGKKSKKVKFTFIYNRKEKTYVLKES